MSILTFKQWHVVKCLAKIVLKIIFYHVKEKYGNSAICFGLWTKMETYMQFASCLAVVTLISI